MTRTQKATYLILSWWCAGCPRSGTIISGRDASTLHENELTTLIDGSDAIICVGIYNLRMAAGADGLMLTFMVVFVGQNGHRGRHAFIGGEHLTHEYW